MNTKINLVLILVIIILIGCLCHFNFKRENFSSSTCNFSPENDPSILNSAECYTACLSEYWKNPSINKGCVDQANVNNCVNKCSNFIPSSISSTGEILPSHCTISDDDIYGKNINNCVTNCQNYGGNVCKKYKRDINGTMVEGIYDVKGNVEENYKECDLNDPAKIKYCSPCVQKCVSCTNSCKCAWNDGINNDGTNNAACSSVTLEDTELNFDTLNFVISAIPENKKIIIVWNIDKNKYNIKEFLLMINKKGTSDIVKTIKIPFNNVGGHFTYTIKDVSNDVPYIINVTALSQQNKVKLSNTLEVTPSEVNIVNYSQFNKKNVVKDTLSSNLFNNLIGKTFEINL